MYDAFDNLDDLKTLILSNNSISSVTDDIFEWNPLELEVWECSINSFCKISLQFFYV